MSQKQSNKKTPHKLSQDDSHGPKQKKGGEAARSASPSFWLLIVAALVAVGLLGIIFKNLSGQGYVVNSSAVEEAEDEPTFRHPLWGNWVYEEVERPGVYAVMVENSSDAWPHAGIEESFLVIEAPVEGSIPRFIVFYGADLNNSGHPSTRNSAALL